MNTVTFKRPDGTTKNSYADWDLLLRPKKIAPPAPKIVKMAIEGRDGDIDLTEWAGEVRYNDRAFPLSFYMTCALSEIETKATEIKNWLHGQRVQITFADDAAYYYDARVTVSDAHADGGIGVLDMSVIAAPYKYKQNVTSTRVWIEDGATRAFRCDRMTTRPKFIAEGSTTFNVCGKNILPFPYSDATLTNNGITYTVNADGTVTATGTATDHSSFYFRTSENPLKLSAGTYTLSGCPDGGGTATYGVSMSVVGKTVLYFDAGAGQTITLSDSLTDVVLCIAIFKGVTVDGLVFAPMLAKEGAKTGYEPYKAKAVSVSSGTFEFADILFTEGLNTLHGTGAGQYVTVEYQEGAL